MKHFQVLMLLLMAGITPLWAQQSFNDMLMKDGELAMTQKDWPKAYRYLEIASFGFLNDEKSYAHAQMLMALVASEMQDKALVETHVAQVRYVMHHTMTQPEGMSEESWNRFQVLAGLKAPPPPPLPQDLSGLKRYVDDHPEVEAAWIALLSQMIEQSSTGDTRSRVAAARKAFPVSEPILGLALAFTLNKDRGRDALAHAKSLLLLNPESALANEVLGNQAVKTGDYDQAGDYYAKVSKSVLSETKAMQAKLKSALDQEAKQAEAERLKKRQESEAAQQKAKSSAKPVDKPKEKIDTRKESTSKAPVTKEATAKKPDVKTVKLPEKTPDVFTLPKPAPVQAQAHPQSAAQNVAAEQAEARVKIDAMIAEARTQANRQPNDDNAQFHLLEVYLDNGRISEAESLMRRLGSGRLGSTSTYAGYFAQYQYLTKGYKANIKALASRKTIDERGRVYLGLSYLAKGKYRDAKGVLAGIDRNNWPVLQGVDQRIDKFLK